MVAQAFVVLANHAVGIVSKLEYHVNIREVDY
jgi:hypothetical protein